MARALLHESIQVAGRPALATREFVGRTLRGGALGTALWCTLYTLQLLPGGLGDTPGVLILAGVGALTGVARLTSWLVGLIQVTTLTVLIVALSPVSERIADGWVREDIVADSGVGAVVVLSGGLNPDTTISAQALDHLISGLELLRAGKSSLLVTTTTETVFPTGFVDSSIDQARVLALSGSRAEWIRTPPGRSTRDEAVESAKLLMPRGIRSVAVVTSPMHTRRACATFEALGFVVACVPARLRSLDGRPLRPEPADRLAAFGDWVYEISAIIEYRIRGWIPAHR
jgi:uncharacterized SAM-binding protein YcdF (DUF218 family)